MIYLALYHGHRDGTGLKVWAARFTDGLTRILTRGRYSHCEIAIRLAGQNSEPQYECYSASIRDGGVRIKTMPLPSAKWDLIELPDSVGERLQGLWQETQGQGVCLLHLVSFMVSGYLKTVSVGFVASGWARRWGWLKAGVFRRTI